MRPTPVTLAALSYLQAGLCVLPATRKGDMKRPTLPTWREYQSRLPSESELSGWMRSADSVSILCGEISGNLEMIDFDMGGAAYAEWRAVVEAASPGLLDRLVIETTPSGGYHVFYKCNTLVPGNAKLATRVFEADGPEPMVVADKEYTPRKVGDSWRVTVTAIETRGEGGLFLCAPSNGYSVVQGSILEIPTITVSERSALIDAARSLDENPQPVKPKVSGVEINPEWLRAETDPVVARVAGRPGDEYNERGDVRAVLRSHGWVQVSSGENEKWRRPGKSDGSSATFNGLTFYVFSSNAAPFEPNTGYSPFSAYATLEHGGDIAAAARALGKEGYGASEAEYAQTKAAEVEGVDLSKFGTTEDEPALILNPKPIGQLIDQHPNLRKPIIHGLVREGETINVIAPPKMRKSWLAIDLSIAVATGTRWLGEFKAEPGRVLIIDNELHEETTASRFPLVVKRRGFNIEEVRERVHFSNLRGRLIDFKHLWPALDQIEPGQYQVIVLDAFYRFLGKDENENDNGVMAGIYNKIDGHAKRLNCSFVMIHHTNKGSQVGKRITDMGAGAGAQSRAADCHLALYPHDDPDCAILDAAVRSWKPIEPMGLRWSDHAWDIDYSIDVEEAMKGKNKSSGKQPGSELADQLSGKAKKVMTAAEFVETYVSEDTTVSSVYIMTRAAGMPRKIADEYMEVAADQGLIERYKDEKGPFKPARLRPMGDGHGSH